MTLPLLLRGISGSGKSTLSRALCTHGKAAGLGCVVHSTDDLFMVDGEYRFDPNLLGEYHEHTMTEFRASLEHRFDLVILDNTNLTMGSLRTGWDAAREWGIGCALIELEPLDLTNHQSRTVHDLPLAALESQHRTFHEHRDAVAALEYIHRWTLPALGCEVAMLQLVEQVIELARSLRK